MKNTRNPILVSVILMALNSPALAQSNNFFGQNLPTAPGAVGSVEPGDSNGATVRSPGMVGGAPAGGDYTSDEKRMQRKYKASISHAKELIEKGDGMMKSAKGNTSHKDYKKGKILKEIGEKSLAELQANNPFPNLDNKPDKPVKAGKKSEPEKKEL